MHVERADTIVADVESYLFVKPGSLAQFITNALVQCEPHAGCTPKPTHQLQTLTQSPDPGGDPTADNCQ